MPEKKKPLRAVRYGIPGLGVELTPENVNAPFSGISVGTFYDTYYDEWKKQGSPGSFNTWLGEGWGYSVSRGSLSTPGKVGTYRPQNNWIPPYSVQLRSDPIPGPYNPAQNALSTEQDITVDVPSIALEEEPIATKKENPVVKSESIFTPQEKPAIPASGIPQKEITAESLFSGIPDATTDSEGNSDEFSDLDKATRRGDVLMGAMAISQIPAMFQRRKIVPDIPSQEYTSPVIRSGSAAFKAAQSKAIDTGSRSAMDYLTRSGMRSRFSPADILSAETQKNIAATQMDVEATNKESILRSEARNKTLEGRQRSIEQGLQIQAGYDSQLGKERAEAMNNLFNIALSDVNMHNRAAELKSISGSSWMQSLINR